MADDRNETHYFLDANPDELERLNLGQAVILDHMKKPVYAPLDFSKPGRRILDSAAANGLWLQDLKAAYGDEHVYIGTDITSIYFPQNLAPSITLSTQSMTKPWPIELQNSFDLVHQRMALPAAGKADVGETLKNFIGLLKPGGWIQLVEADHSISRGPAMDRFFRLLQDIFVVMKTGADYAPNLLKWFKDEYSLEDVDEQIFDIPLGKANPKAEMQGKSTRMFRLAIKGLVAVARDISTSFSKNELDDLVSRVEDELNTVGGTFRLHCVWGRKPMDIQNY